MCPQKPSKKVFDYVLRSVVFRDYFRGAGMNFIDGWRSNLINVNIKVLGRVSCVARGATSLPKSVFQFKINLL